MKTIAELNEENFDRTIAAADMPVMVDFYAPWCGPCKMLSPLLETLAGQFADRILFFKVNVDDAPELATRFEITGVPTMLLLREGEVRDRLVGLLSPRTLVSRLEALVESPGSTAAPEGSACCH
jgi:thioredoxin 1